MLRMMMCWWWLAVSEGEGTRGSHFSFILKEIFAHGRHSFDSSVSRVFWIHSLTGFIQRPFLQVIVTPVGGKKSEWLNYSLYWFVQKTSRFGDIIAFSVKRRATFLRLCAAGFYRAKTTIRNYTSFNKFLCHLKMCHLYTSIILHLLSLLEWDSS